MSLQQYRRKRRFDATAEPAPRPRGKGGQRPRFVVQLHHASRRHYDFRLQVDGVLRSWAVPKGPSYDPSVKRMAIEVEDHPLDYAGFEGEIPQGQYGGGHVARFDQGVWSTEGDPAQQLAKGHLRFELFGEKLKGGWHLVRSGTRGRQPQWLLFKDNDAHAGPLEADDLLADVRPAPAADVRRAGRGKTAPRALRAPPRVLRRGRGYAARALKLDGARRAPAPSQAFSVQLATRADRAPQGADWVHELKWDGYRLAVTVEDGQVRLWSRNGLDWTPRLPDIQAAVQALGLTSAALDGELIAGRGRREDFNLLQAVLSGERQGTLSLVLFDVLHLDGVDVTAAPLLQRKALLQHLLGEQPPAHLAFSSHIPGDADAAAALAAQQDFEGIIAKRGDRPYRGGRSDDWRKIKQVHSDEFAVVGYTPPKGSRSGFGALLLARALPDGTFVFAGRVGTGFTAAMMEQVAARFPARTRATPSVPVDGLATDLRGARWFAPAFVVEVFYRGVGRQQLLRQPSLKALRPDKHVEDLMDSDRGTARKSGRRATKGKGRRTGKREAALPTLSSPEKRLYPQDRITKQQVWDYYLAVAPYLLPEIVGRPLSVVRCPAGTGKACFFQKHLTAGMERVASVRLQEDSGAQADYLVVNDLAGLMELVQFNSLEFHPWGALAKAPDRADRVVFDLDPGQGVPFAEVKRAARHIRRLLRTLQLEAFLRTSGGKGLHVVVPLRPSCDWELARRFAKAFAEALAQSEPDRFLATASKTLRNKRIFVDYLRNGRGATAVASYSLRARPGAPVALPLAWSELSRLSRADAFSLQAVVTRLKRRRIDPWQDIGTIRQSLTRWAKGR